MPVCILQSVHSYCCFSHYKNRKYDSVSLSATSSSLHIWDSGKRDFHSLILLPVYYIKSLTVVSSILWSFIVMKIILLDWIVFVENLWLLNIVPTSQKEVGFEIPTAVVMKSTILWDIMPSNPLKVNWRFGGTYHPIFRVEE
jgi:hypothetical protein